MYVVAVSLWRHKWCFRFKNSENLQKSSKSTFFSIFQSKFWTYVAKLGGKIKVDMFLIQINKKKYHCKHAIASIFSLKSNQRWILSIFIKKWGWVAVTPPTPWLWRVTLTPLKVLPPWFLRQNECKGWTYNYLEAFCVRVSLRFSATGRQSEGVTVTSPVGRGLKEIRCINLIEIKMSWSWVVREFNTNLRLLSNSGFCVFMVKMNHF